MRGYKGFNQDFTCRNFKYEVGQEYTHTGDVSLCNSGFHFCENPFDVFSYYDPSKRFAEVEGGGVSDQTESDSKRVSKKLRIVAELSLNSLIQAGVKFILDKVDFVNAKETNTGNQSAATNTGDQSAATNTGNQSAATNTGNQSAATNTGDRSAATNTGYQSAATNTGYQSAATNTGDRSAATNTGEEGCAVSLGIEGRANGALGCWLTLAEWAEEGGSWHRVDVKTARVDGEVIKPNTFYTLKSGKFVEVK